MRLERDKFCGTLERFWARFSRSWDVLLHGNPAVDVFSGVKLAHGGELGYGVGEEDWGSGERAVLEDLTYRTEGLVDLVVSRFGESQSEEESRSASDADALPWMGSGNEPVASDGVVFGGIGALERRSLRDVSLWMRQIYTYGDYAYAVRDNPLRERRKRRRRNPPQQANPPNGAADSSPPTSQNLGSAEEPRTSQPKGSVRHESSTGQHDLAEDTSTPENAYTHSEIDKPNIPPPIVSAAEEALQNATRQAEQEQPEAGDAEDSGTTLGIPDHYMKYLTFGLSTLGKTAPKKRPRSSRQTSTADLKPPQLNDRVEKIKRMPQAAFSGDEDDAPMLTHLEPMPDGETLKSKIAVQKRQENKGYFVIGLTGDLDEPPQDDDAIVSDSSFVHGSDGSRIVLRTVQVATIPHQTSDDIDEVPLRKPSVTEFGSIGGTKTNFRRLRLLMYVHRPFVYCFLFENRTSSLQYTKFYRDLHRNLVPIHKPLLASTDPAKVAERIENSHATPSDSETASTSSRTNKLPSKGSNSTPIFNLIFDPRRLTLHTSIPNIPKPGTPAAEGILSSLMGDSSTRPSWTRVEALNVHSQILNTLTSVKHRKSEIERTSKTSRGWWVVWMKIPPAPPTIQIDAEAAESITPDPEYEEKTITNQTSDDPPDMHRVAFLVRKASEPSTNSNPAATSSRALSSMFGNMTLGLGSKEDEKTGGISAGWGSSALAGGIGVDARRYVEGLLSLNR